MHPYAKVATQAEPIPANSAEQARMPNRNRPWLESYRGIPFEIDPDKYRSVVHMLEDAMVRYADRPAFRCFRQTLTYADVDRLSAAFAAYLQAEVKVQRGDRIAVMLPNLPAFPIAMLGILRAGGVQVNINPLYTPRELEHQLTDAGCKVIVIFSGATSTLASIIDKTSVSRVVTVNPGDGTATVLPSPPMDRRLAHTTSFAAALQAGLQQTRTPLDLNGEDLIFLQYTGGTTGLAKGAALTHRNLVANVEQFKAMRADALRDGEDVIVTAIPLYHIFALTVNLITYFSLGADNWLVPDPRDLDGFVATLKAARPTEFSGVNTLFNALSMHPGIHDVDWSRLRYAGGGGAAVMATTSNRWEAITGRFIAEGYGLSETSPVVSMHPSCIERFTGTSGLPVPSTDIKLLGSNGYEVAPGQSGEICVKGPQVMAGYWHKPEVNAVAFTADGYFRTGDIGQIDERGFLKIVDRKKDMVLVSGFNVYPNEVEAVASACPGVSECACVGVPDEKSGEAVKIFVVMTADATLTEADVIAHCRQALAAYKVPKVVQFVDALPKNNVGKILRRALRSDT